MLDKLTAMDFSAYLNKRFSVSSESAGKYDMELIEVSNLATGNVPEEDTTNGRPFSVVFLGSAQPVLPQGIYEIKRDDFGPFDIFIVPVGLDTGSEGIRYEAVFN